MSDAKHTVLKRKHESSCTYGRNEAFSASKRTASTNAVEEARAIDLLELLDLSAITTHAGVSLRFHQIASLLLLDYHLVCCSANEQCTFEVLEIEFYLIKPRIHEDPFTHGTEEQRQSGRWYFHRPPRRTTSTSSETSSPAGYRGGTRKGLDLTFGIPVSITSRYFASTPTVLRAPTQSAAESNASDQPRGGILLRSLRRVSDGRVVSGPSLVVDEILRISGAANIAELVSVKWNGDVSALRDVSGASGSTPSRRVSLYLKTREASTAGRGTHLQAHARPRIYRSPRIGLDLSHAEISKSIEAALRHPRVKFVSQPYRYFTHPRLLTVNGRGQTFLGVYHDDLCSDAAAKGGRMVIEASLETIVAQTGLKENTAQKYLQDYLRGYQCGTLATFIGAAGKGASASPGSFLSMMGALRRAQEGRDSSGK